MVVFTSPNIEYKVDAGGQFCPDYYGMKFELIECIHSEQVRSLSQICFPYCFTLDQKLDISFSQYISSYVIKNQSKSLCDLADFFFKEIPYSDQILFRAFFGYSEKNKPKKLKTQGNSHENWKQNSEKTQLELF